MIYLPIELLVSGLTRRTPLVKPHRNARSDIPLRQLLIINTLNPIQIHPSHNLEPVSPRPLQDPNPPFLAIRQTEEHLAFAPVFWTNGDSVGPASARWCLHTVKDWVFFDCLARWGEGCSSDQAGRKAERDSDKVALFRGFEASCRGEEHVTNR